MKPSVTSRSGSRSRPSTSRAHESLFDSLARRGRFREGDEHLAVSMTVVQCRRLQLRRAANGLAHFEHAPRPHSCQQANDPFG